MAEGFDEKSESIFLLKRHQAFQRLFFFFFSGLQEKVSGTTFNSSSSVSGKEHMG